MKKIVSIILVLLWMLLIFYMSSMKGNESTDKSLKSIEYGLKIVYKISDKLSITNNLSNNKKYILKQAKRLNYPLRKCVHMFEYFVLMLLLYNMFRLYNISFNKIILFSLIICFIYASSDEFHQLFTERTATIIDVLIDFIGSIISVLILLIRKNIKKLV